MGHSNGKITAPINLSDDVYATLGIGAIGIGYDLGYACANTHGKINKWSKKKPVRHSNLGIMTDEQFRSVSYGLSFTEGGNHDYGIFSYSAPNGGSSAPYRLTDFDGYNQNAQTGLGLKNYNMNYGCDRSQIPKMTNASESVLLVTTNIVYKHTDGYYHNITNPVILRMKKDSGPTPSSVDR